MEKRPINEGKEQSPSKPESLCEKVDCAQKAKGAINTHFSPENVRWNIEPVRGSSDVLQVTGNCDRFQHTIGYSFRKDALGTFGPAINSQFPSYPLPECRPSL